MNERPFFLYLNSRMLTMKDNMGEQWLSKEQRSRQTGGGGFREANVKAAWTYSAGNTQNSASWQKCG